MLDPCWTYAGLVLDPHWTHAGPMLDPCWTRAGPMLDPCWTHAGRGSPYRARTGYNGIDPAEYRPRPWRRPSLGQAGGRAGERAGRQAGRQVQAGAGRQAGRQARQAGSPGPGSQAQAARQPGRLATQAGGQAGRQTAQAGWHAGLCWTRAVLAQQAHVWACDRHVVLRAEVPDGELQERPSGVRAGWEFMFTNLLDTYMHTRTHAYI